MKEKWYDRQEEFYDMTDKKNEPFSSTKMLIGMLHVGTPGSPGYEKPLECAIEDACYEAGVYEQAGYTALLLENMFDRPYLKGKVGPETVAAMTAIGMEVRKHSKLPVGVQILAGANREAMAVAKTIGASFIRAEAFVFAHVADEGIMEADAGELLRYRKNIGAQGISVFVDIKKKHASHAITDDLNMAKIAKAAEFFQADGLILTGPMTGEAANPKDLEDVKKVVRIPVWMGSGITPKNMEEFKDADGYIVGSYVKNEGVWSNMLHNKRVGEIVMAFRELNFAD